MTGSRTPGSVPVGSSSEPRRRASVVGLRSSVVVFKKCVMNHATGLGDCGGSDIGWPSSPPTAESSGRFRHRTKSVASRPTAGSSSRFSRALDSLGLSEVILGSRNLATSVSLERKGSARDLHELHESSEWEVGTFQTSVPSHSQCVTPTHGRAQFQASGFWAKSQKVALVTTTTTRRRGERSLGTPARLGLWW